MQIFHCHLRLPEGTRGRYIEPGGDRQHGASPSFMLVEPLHDLQGIGSGRSLGAVFGNMGVHEILVGCTNLQTGEFTANHLAYRPFFFPQRFWGRASASACWIFKRFVISSSKAGSSKHDRLYKYPPETHLLAQLKTKVHALVTCHALCQPGKWNSALTSR